MNLDFIGPVLATVIPPEHTGPVFITHSPVQTFAMIPLSSGSGTIFEELCEGFQNPSWAMMGCATVGLSRHRGRVHLLQPAYHGLLRKVGRF